VRARDLIDSRRRFTEAVLAGASAGVIGLNADGRITILNRSAERLIACAESEALGRPLTMRERRELSVPKSVFTSRCCFFSSSVAFMGVSFPGPRLQPF
jgi:nitrogen fixation/metabolism regulation signal transduction histidine kinase